MIPGRHLEQLIQVAPEGEGRFNTDYIAYYLNRQYAALGVWRQLTQAQVIGIQYILLKLGQRKPQAHLHGFVVEGSAPRGWAQNGVAGIGSDQQIWVLYLEFCRLKKGEEILLPDRLWGRSQGTRAALTSKLHLLLPA